MRMCKRILSALLCVAVLLGGILPGGILAEGESIRIELENVVTAQHVAAGLVETRTGADWSGGGFAFMNAAGVDGTGNSMTFTLTVPSAGDYTLSITDRDSADRGIFRADFNGEEVATVDFYAASAGFVTHPLGTVTFSSTTGTLTLTCVGANPASNKKYGLAADYVTLTPVEGADASGTCGDNLTWNYNSSTKTLTISGTGAMADYTLFTRAPWNTYHSSITTVTISNSVTSIGDYAFYNCTGMTSVTIPDSVTRIGNSAFYYCTKLTSITIPDSVTSIGNYAFYNCTKLTSITIPDSVTSMGSGAFDSCSNVTIYATTDSVASQYASQKGHRFVAVIFLEGQACYPSWTVDISPTCTEPGSQSHHSVFENEPYGSVVIPATGHAWQLSDHKDATCTENGYDDYVCANDPTHTKRETIPATGHTYSTEWTVDVAPTCEQLGSKSHHCENCDAVIDVTEIPVLGHDWQLSGHKDATCTEDGYDDYVCANDSTHTKREIITATGHTYSTEWTVDAAPTCELPGSKSHHCENCDAVIDVTEIPVLGHDWQLSGHKDATCTEDGYDDYVCTNDSTHTKRDIIPATGHNWKAVGRMAATCTEDGYVDYECVNDPTHTKRETVPAAGHTYSTEWTVDAAPTCTEPGSKSHHCLYCGAKNDVTVVSATGHHYGEWEVVIPATCTAPGTRQCVCTDCGDVQTEEIAILPHTYSTEWTVDVAPTCTKSGYKSHHCLYCVAKTDITAVSATGHNWKVAGRMAATCTEDGYVDYMCVNDPTHTKRDIIPATGHNYVGTVIQNPTCTMPGVMLYICSHDKTHTYMAPIPAAGHDWEEEWTVDTAPTCTEPGSKSHHCGNCDAVIDVTEIPVLGHDWQLSGHKDATCTEDGYDDYVCANDSTHTKREIITATGHTYSTEWTVDAAPTCEQPGSKSHHCGNCDAVIDVTEIPATGHDWQLSDHKDATCTENGYDDYVCANDPTHTKRETIPATGHNWKAVGRMAATCTEDGYVDYECVNDPTHTKRETIPAAGHTYSTEWTVDAVPTCTGPGSKSHHCQNCDAKADVTVIPATGHRYGGWETVKAPTCTADGSHRRVCADCGDIQTGVVPATGHEWDTVWTVDQPATETADGVKSRHCLHCDARTDLTVIPKVVHVGAWEVVTPATCTEAGLERRVCTDCGQVDTRAIPALGHDWETGWTVDRPATATMPGEQTHHCTRCSERTDVTVIPILGGENARLTVTADTFAAKRGDVVTVSVAVAGLTEENYWNTLTFTLQYDDLQLELLSGEDGETALPGPAMSAKSTMSVNARIGSVKLAIVDGDGQAQNGTIVSLRFRVKDTVAIGETVACQVQTDEFLRTVIENGRPIGKIWLTTPAADTVAWQVSDYTLADIDENGEITAADALMALQGATGKIGLNDVQQSAADVDGSGDVTAADALLILQYATGKINQFARL